MLCNYTNKNWKDFRLWERMKIRVRIVILIFIRMIWDQEVSIDWNIIILKNDEKIADKIQVHEAIQQATKDAADNFTSSTQELVLSAITVIAVYYSIISFGSLTFFFYFFFYFQ